MGAITPWNNFDIAAMLGLINRMHETKGGAHARRRTLLDGLCRLTAVSVGVLLIGGVLSAGLPAQWFAADGQTCDPLLKASFESDDDQTDPALKKMLKRANRRQAGWVGTLTRRELLSDRKWYASAHVRSVRSRVGLDDCIYSALATPDNLVCICLFRPSGSRGRFGDREKNILNVLHPACAWIYGEETSANEVHMLALSPRERQTLRKLLEGSGEKEIAGEMRLSVNTVHHYVKALYKHFHVSSRAELLARWMGGK